MKFVGYLVAAIGLVLLVLFVIGTASCIPTKLEVGRDIGAPLNRAQVAANPAEMDSFLADVQAGLEEHGYTEGHWTPYNKNNDNDFAVAYAAVLSLRTRLETVKTFDQSSVEYQVAMDDLRGTIRELNIGQQSEVDWSYWWIWPALIIGLILLGVGVFVITESEY